jgi:hypothetical protein
MYPLLLLFMLLPQPPAAPAPEEPYRKIEITDADVKAAAKAALSAVKRKGTLISAERHTISANNVRLCISMNRGADYEFARVVLSRNSAKRWEVTVWSWGSCGR